jgi:hypothetical protein
MACLADTAAAHRELARAIDSIPSVAAVDYLAPHESPSGRPETEIVVEATRRDTVPNSVTAAVVRSSLGVAAAAPGIDPDYKRVVVR